MRQDNPALTFHELLLQIVQEFGESILTESRLRGILSDLGRGSDIWKYQNVIARAVNDQVGSKILLLRELDDADFSLRLNTLKQTFQEENFFRFGIADYIINSYVYALGWIDKLDQYDDTDGCEDGKGKAGELNFVRQEDGEYCGNFNKENEKSGFGVMKKEDGVYYAGEWKLNTKNGIGMSVDADRNKYAGEWRLNRSAGVGVQIRSKDGVRYAGEWKNGKLNGPAILFYPNGERLCIRFQNGELMNESGIFYLRDGTYVIGSMTTNGPNGICFHFYKDGSCEKEEWNDGNFNM